MERRELLKMIAVFTGAAMVGGEFILTGCKADPKATDEIVFSPETLALLNEVGETIIPRTDTPGAKDANVAAVMQTVVRDCYWPANQKVFMQGIKDIDVASNKMHGVSFMQANVAQRKELLLALEKEASEFNKQQSEKDQPKRDEYKANNKEFDFIESPRHYYTMMKQLTMLAYFSSKEGLTQALNYIPTPGRYDGAYKLQPGDRPFTG